MSHPVLGNINLARKICTFLPLEELPNVCKTNSSLRRLTQTPEAASTIMQAMLRTVNNANANVYQRFNAARVKPGSQNGPLAFIRQMPALRQLKVTTSDGRFFLMGLERLPHARNLTSLDLTYQGSVEDVEFSALANYTQLQKLRFDCSAIDGRTIDALIKLPSLQEIALLNCVVAPIYGLNSNRVGRLLEKFPDLRSFTLGFGEYRGYITPDPRAGAASLLARHGKNLTSISLHGNMDPPLDMVGMIKACPNLTFLDVTGSQFATRWTMRDAGGYDVIWYEVLEKLARERPKLVIKGPPRD